VDAARARLGGAAAPVSPTPLELLAGREAVYLKREDTHELGAFKWRGALPTLAQYAAHGADAVVTASTGNHGAATAWAAEREGVRAIVFVPEVASETKLGLMAALGAEIRHHGADMDEAKEEARRFAADAGLPFFEDGAEPAQFDGYGEIAVELLDQLGEPPAAVVVPVGNGALLIGIGRVLAERSPSTQRVGVVAAGAPVMAESWDAGEVVEDDRSETFADGLAVRVAIPQAVEELVSLAQRMLRVSERELAAAVAVYASAGIRVEGAGAAALAGLTRLDPVEGPVVLIVTGRNIDDELWQLAVDDSDAFPD
jgi:threonine dehydratase